MSERKKILVIGSTGSIGCQTLDVIAKHKDKLQLTGLVTNTHSKKMHSQANFFEVCESRRIVYSGNPDAKSQIEALIADDETDIVVNAASGAAGVRASYWTLKHDKTLALANKESLVVGGDIIIPMALERARQHNCQPRLLPIDSEHGAIFQCLVGESEGEICGRVGKTFKNIWITASGGPFRNSSIQEMKNVTPQQALNHPTWQMGPKITIDSASMMNKGLEVIEAHHLFGVDYEQIKVVIQPQSAIHSMVEYCDGSVKAHLGPTDMRIPIQYALSFPQRWDTPVESATDFATLGTLDFQAPDMEKFPCLRLAYEAGKNGNLYPCVMNAANEVAVEGFLNGKVGFCEIPVLIEKVLFDFDGTSSSNDKVENIDQLNEIDEWARQQALCKVQKGELC